MGEVSREAGHRPADAAKHRGAKPPGSAKGSDTETVRIQLHLGGQTAKRLNVHAALMGRNASREADRILRSYLAQHGKGRELFGPVDDEDRPAEGSPVKESDDGRP